jgi:hypothetical protein
MQCIALMIHHSFAVILHLRIIIRVSFVYNKIPNVSDEILLTYLSHRHLKKKIVLKKNISLWRSLNSNYLPPPLWVQIPAGTMGSFMLGNYPASLRTVGGSTQVLVRACMEGHLRYPSTSKVRTSSNYLYCVRVT